MLNITTEYPYINTDVNVDCGNLLVISLGIPWDLYVMIETRDQIKDNQLLIKLLSNISKTFWCMFEMESVKWSWELLLIMWVNYNKKLWEKLKGLFIVEPLWPNWFWWLSGIEGLIADLLEKHYYLFMISNFLVTEGRRERYDGETK